MYTTVRSTRNVAFRKKENKQYIKILFAPLVISLVKENNIRYW